MGYENGNIGEKLCKTARVWSTISKIAMVISLVVGVIAFLNREEEVAIILLPCAFVCLSGVIFTWPMLNAFGQMANDLREIKKQNEK